MARVGTPPVAAARPISYCGFTDDACARIAHQLIARSGNRLPDWRSVAVIVPHASIAPRLRRQLLEALQHQGRAPAFAGLRIVTLRGFIETVTPPLPNTVSSQALEIIIVDALRGYPQLYNHGSPWTLASELVTLFEQLSVNQVELPAEPIALRKRLREAYGNGAYTHPALEREAAIVQTLWNAMRAQLAADRMVDDASAYVSRLSDYKSRLADQWMLYVLPDPQWARCEQWWMEQLVGEERAFLLHQGRAYMAPETRTERFPLWNALCNAPSLDENARECLWDQALNPSAATSLAERARQFSRNHPLSPVADHVQFYAAPSAENEARAIELCLRSWIADGHRDLCVATDDRRLARRLRALLERGNIQLNDYAGWALSTTRAAAMLERWLECIESDFEHNALLDVLHSPLLKPPPDLAEQWHLIIYRFDRDIIRRENIHSGLERYRHHLRLRLRRVDRLESHAYGAVERLLAMLFNAAQPLLKLTKNSRLARPLRRYIDALLDSLTLLGARDSLENDDAGIRVLEAVVRTDVPATLTLTWSEFRTWLGRLMESHHFTPMHAAKGVTLLNLSQTLYQRFDAVIIAGLTQDKLPGNPATSGMFNQRVRAELGLPSAAMQHELRMYQWRHALACAPRVLLTWQHCEENDTLPSPWVQSLETFHQIAYGTSLKTPVWTAWTESPATEMRVHNAPPPIPEQPKPSLAPALAPKRFSARTHQHLIDCPYLFFAKHVLRLEKPDSVRDAMSKADQGRLIHRCLQAFHQAIPGLPGPWSGGYEHESKSAACKLLRDIAQSLYATEIEDNFEHRGWLTAWLNTIPRYIDWQWSRASDWRIHDLEVAVKSPARDADYMLEGRLDRIDENTEGYAIIDYKTGGKTPSSADVANGEEIQLVHYVLAFNGSKPVLQVEYVKLENEKVTNQVTLCGEQLEENAERTAARLREMHRLIAEGAALPAWGDAKICSRCEAAGICRRAQWTA